MLRWVLTLALSLSAISLAADESAADLLTARVPHQLSVEKAHERVQQMLDYWHRRFGVQSKWEGERVAVKGSIFGMDIDATFEVRADEVDAQAADPGWLWRDRAVDYTTKKLKKYLHPTYAEP